MPPPPELVEVRCAGCGETLEVEPGLTEFACPDCGTQQQLPPELMPRRPRRALPIPGRGRAAVAAAAVPVPVPAPEPASMPCGGCGALLSVPAGLGRFACPLCGVQLVVDGARLRLCLASPAAATVSVVAPPPGGVALASPSPSPRRRPEVERYDHPIRSAQTSEKFPSHSIQRDETYSYFRTDTRKTIHNMQKEPLSHSVHRDDSRIEALNKTTMNSSTRISRLQPGTESLSVENVQPEPPIQASCALHTQAVPLSYLVPRDHAQGQDSVVHTVNHGHKASDVSSTMKQDKTERVFQSVFEEQVQTEYQSNTAGCNPKRKRSGKSNQKKKKGLMDSPNEGLHLRRSKLLTKTDEPIQRPAASPIEFNSDPSDIDRAIASLCPAPLHQHQVLQTSSSELPIVDEAISPASSIQIMSQGSDGKSSGKHKRKGRGRSSAKLIEPRREVDKPVLTPNSIDNWNVNPLCTKVASTLTILMKQKYPGSTYLPVDQHGDVPPDGEVVHHWHQYPPETRASILNDFLERYKWAPSHEAACLKLFDRRAVKQFSGLLCVEKKRAREMLAAVLKAKETTGAHRSNEHTESEEEDAREEPGDKQIAERSEDDDPLQWKPFPPAWMYPNWWNKLCEHWAKEENVKMSSQNRKNRYTGGRAYHTTGSRSLAMHRQLMEIENGGKPVSELEVFNKTHKLKSGSGEFVCEKARRTVEGFKKRMEEAGDKQVDPLLAWLQEVGGRNRGRYYGLSGFIDKSKLEEIAKSIPGFGKRGQRQKFTQEQVQQMINQAMQGLNETWEKKFKSLKRSVVPFLSVDQEHAPGSSAAGGGDQEDRSRHQVQHAAVSSAAEGDDQELSGHQDTSDSQHGEGPRSTRHADNEDDEVVSIDSRSV